jgi:hypothetical protein
VSLGVVVWQQNGGRSNAYTDMEHTNYYFTYSCPELTRSIRCTMTYDVRCM